MLFPILGEANDTVDEQFHSFEAFANSQHDGMEPTRGRNKSLWHHCPFPQSILGHSARRGIESLSMARWKHPLIKSVLNNLEFPSSERRS